VAALQGAILLIAARRSDQISAELATHDYKTNLDAFELIKSLEVIIEAIQANTEASASRSTEAPEV
jgi:hypothetical protein